MFLAQFLFASKTSRMRLIANTRAVSTGGVLGSIIGLVVGVYVMGSTIPDAITLISNATLWADTPSVIQTLGGTVLGLIAVVACIFILLRAGGIGGD
jgi:hypothetical protein